jgi:hypothetical protein
MKVSALNEGGYLAWVEGVTRISLLLRIAGSRTPATQTKTIGCGGQKLLGFGRRSG